MSAVLKRPFARLWLARRALLVGASLALCTTGCDGIGRAVVGDKPPDRGAPLSCDQPTPVCDRTPPPAAPAGVPPSAASIELAACASQPLPAACGSAPVDASDCQAPLNVDDDSDAQAALGSQQCANLSVVDDRTEPAARVLRLEAADLSSANITIQSALPLTVEFADAWLTHVWFELRGPVTLRIVSSRACHDVRVSAPDDAGAELELEQADALDLSVGSDTAAFHGAVSIRRSTLQRVQLTADSIELESAALSDATLSTARLEAADATLKRIAVLAQRSLLASCTVGSASFADCGAFSAIQGVYQDTTIAACSEGLRLYGTEFMLGALDGAIVLDHAMLQQVRLGLLEPATIQAWDSALSYLRFCSAANAVTFGGSDSVACVYPGSGLPCDVDVCVVAQAMFIADTPDCAALQAEPRACALPQPERMRPPFE